MTERDADAIAHELEPVVTALGLSLFDVEKVSNVVRVTVDRAGGVNLDDLAAANKAVSAYLDELDPIPGRYTLEVSSPGVERRLRTPAHFVGAIGETVSMRLLAGEVGTNGTVAEGGAGGTGTGTGTGTSTGTGTGSSTSSSTSTGGQGARRLQGVVASADDEGLELQLADGTARVTYGSIERARTVFEWGGAPPPGGGRGNKGKERVQTQ